MDQESEHRAARQACGLLDLSGEGWIHAKGEGTLPFLQRLVANDVLSVKVGQGRRSLLLDAKGHVQSDLAILRTGEDEVHVGTPEPARETTFKMLSLYGTADPVEFADLAQERALLTLQGPRAHETVSALVSDPFVFGRELDHARVSLAGIGPARLVRHDRSGLGGIDVIVETALAAKAKAALLERASALGGGEISPGALDVLRLEAGRARFGADFGPETIPQEARLEEPSADALSFEKGCFLGQETVARLRFRGHVNKLLVGLVSDAELASGVLLKKDGKEIGKITSTARSPLLSGKSIALGYVKRDQSSPGTELEAVLAAGTATTRVVALPFSP